MRRARAFPGRAIKATKILARDSRVPKPLRWLAAVGLLPLPGPVDEAVLLLIAPVFMIFYRRSMRDAWQQTLAASVVGVSEFPAAKLACACMHEGGGCSSWNFDGDPE